MKTNYLELEKINQEFEVTGEVLFNNRLVKGAFWHSNKGSDFCMSSVDYGISVPPNSVYTFPTKKEAESWLKKYKGKKIIDKSKVKIKRSFSNWDCRTTISCQLEVEYFNRVLEFKKTTIKVLKWYE
jgi:hypothetical protein